MHHFCAGPPQLATLVAPRQVRVVGLGDADQVRQLPRVERRGVWQKLSSTSSLVLCRTLIGGVLKRTVPTGARISKTTACGDAGVVEMDHNEEEGARWLPAHGTSYWADLPKWYIECVQWF